MENNNFEEKMFNYFRDNQDVPSEIEDTIWNIDLNKRKIKRINIRNAIITIISLLTMSTGVVFAKDITNCVQNIFKDREGVDTAIQSGYIYDNIYENYSDDQNIRIQVEEMIMDDYTLDINFLVKHNDSINFSEYEKFQIKDLLITDENDNILCFFDIDKAKKSFYEQKGNSVDNQFILDNSVNCSSEMFINRHIDGNSFIYTLKCSAIENPFPKSEKLYITFNTITVKDEIDAQKKYEIDGKWYLEVDVPKIFTNRQTTEYIVKKCNNENVFQETIKARVYETGLNFELDMYWGDYETEKLRLEEIRKKDVLASRLIQSEKCYVENENGEKFYSAQSSAEDAGYGFTPDGKLHMWQTFNITKFDMTDSIRVVLSTINNDEIIIELEELI